MRKNIEDEVKELYECYVDACAMCTDLKCDNCALRTIIDDLEEILENKQ